MDKAAIIHWLKEDDPAALAPLWRDADRVRKARVGDQVHLRGLIEISNFCVRRCGYCGISMHNSGLARYRMTRPEILDCARQAVKFGYGTVVLQAGEDPGLSKEFIAGIVREIKSHTPLAVTLSLGERADDELIMWRSAGADRYLLRFETSNRELYDAIHPPLPGRTSDRFAMLSHLHELGYEAGSGVMIGIPGQSYGDLAQDILNFRELKLEMIGVGPYLPHPATPLGRSIGVPSSMGVPLVSSTPVRAVISSSSSSSAAAATTTVVAQTGSMGETPMRLTAGTAMLHDHAPNTELMTYKVIALARILCPGANIPSTTALATLNLAQGREIGLSRGANVVMPNLTPTKYRAMYEIYPAKACIYETPSDCDKCLKRRIESIGRRVGTGPGDSRVSMID
jgi:biotin synthase